MTRTHLWAILATAGSALCAATSLGQIANPEIEGNDSKAAATVANSAGAGLQALDFITGTTISASAAGLDYFRVTVKTAPPAIYQNRLVITTSGTAGHTGTIRGLLQSAGVITAGSDSTGQASSSTSVPARINQWYGFGKGEQFFYRVAGGAATTAPYVATMETTVITPEVVSTPIAAGPVAISTIGQGHTNDTDFWVYDSNFNPLPTFGNDENSTMGGGTGIGTQSFCRRTLAPGRYYVAMGAFNTFNDLASPSDDRDPNYTVADFPGFILSTATSTASINMSFAIIHNGGTETVTSFRTVPFGIAWTAFDVAPAANPGGTGSATPNNPTNCGAATTLISVTPTPGSNPTSLSFTVTADTVALGGGTVNLINNGGGVFEATVPVDASTLSGLNVVGFTVTDNFGRTGNGEINLNILDCPPANDLPATAIDVVIGTPIDGTTVGAMADSGFPACITSNTAPGVWYKFIGDGTTLSANLCASLAPYDSKLTVYCASNGITNLSCIDGNDDSEVCGPNSLLSDVTFCSELGAPYFVLVHGFSGASGPFTLNVTSTGPACNTAIACLPAGKCCTVSNCAVLTELACLAGGGTYGGNGTDCSSFSSSFSSTDAFPLAIPDASSVGVSSTIVIPAGSGTVSNLAVRVGINHTWVGDVVFGLDNGTTFVTLVAFIGDSTGTSVGDSSNFQGQYTFLDTGADIWAAAATGDSTFNIPPGTYRPADELTGALPSPSLAAFDGAPLEGTWTLFAADFGAADLGTITSFTLFNGFGQGSPCGSTCVVDFNADGFLNQEDLSGYLGAFLDESVPPGPSGTSAAPCAGQPAPYDTLGFAADFNRDCDFNQEDLSGFIVEYFSQTENPAGCIPG